MVQFDHCKMCTVETGRHPGCHSTCAYYIQDKRNREAELAIIEAKKNVYSELNAYLRNSKVSYAKRRGGKDALAKAYL